MRLGHRRRDAPEVNLTPLIDVVFLLLIFFMVSTTFEQASQLEIELPEASAEPRQQQPESIDLSIDASGRYFVNGRALVNGQVETLRRALEGEAGADSDRVLVINADLRTSHQAVVTAMDAASQAGLVHLRFATRLADADAQ